MNQTLPQSTKYMYSSLTNNNKHCLYFVTCFHLLGRIMLIDVDSSDMNGLSMVTIKLLTGSGPTESIDLLLKMKNNSTVKAC